MGAVSSVLSNTFSSYLATIYLLSQFYLPTVFVCTNILYAVLIDKQMCTWFLEITFVFKVNVFVCVCHLRGSIITDPISTS